VKKSVLALVVMSAIAGVARAADLPTAEPAPAAPPSPAACESVKQFVATDCALTWNGITLYGVYDVGVGWVSTAYRKTAITTKANRWSTGTAITPNGSLRRTTCSRRVWASRAR